MKKILSLMLLTLFVFTPKSYAMEQPSESFFGGVFKGLVSVFYSGTEEVDVDEAQVSVSNDDSSESTNLDAPESIPEIEDEYQGTNEEVAEAVEEEIVEEVFDTNQVFEWLERGNFQAISEYIEQGGDINIQDSEGSSLFNRFIRAICLSAANDNIDFNSYIALLEVLLERVDNDHIYDAYNIFNTKMRSIPNELSFEVLRNFQKINVRLINYLIEIERNAWDNANNTEEFKTILLFNSIKFNNLNIIKKLIEHFNVNPDSRLGFDSAMSYAARHKQRHIRSYLQEQSKQRRQRQ